MQQKGQSAISYICNGVKRPLRGEMEMLTGIWGFWVFIIGSWYVYTMSKNSLLCLSEVNGHVILQSQHIMSMY